jgi:S1-C subfamily serine protease
LTPALQEKLGFQGVSDVDAGVVVVEVMPSSPAAQAGLQQGDIILSVGETDTTTASDLQQAVSDVAVGSELSLLVLRGGEELEISVVTEKLPS